MTTAISTIHTNFQQDLSKPYLDLTAVMMFKSCFFKQLYSDTDSIYKYLFRLFNMYRNESSSSEDRFQLNKFQNTAKKYVISHL